MKKFSCMVMIVLGLFLFAGCMKEDSTAEITFSDGVAKFENNDYTIGELLKNCNDVLKKNFKISDHCQVYEAYIFLEKDGKLLTTYQSEFEITLVDEDTRKQYIITTEDGMKNIYIRQEDKKEIAKEIQVTPWNDVVEVLNEVDFAKIADNEDNYIVLEICGLMDISESGMDISTEYREDLYIIQSGKMKKMEPEEIKGEYYGFIFAGCISENDKPVEQNSSITVHHAVGVLK